MGHCYVHESTARKGDLGSFCWLYGWQCLSFFDCLFTLTSPDPSLRTLENR